MQTSKSEILKTDTVLDSIIDGVIEDMEERKKHLSLQDIKDHVGKDGKDILDVFSILKDHSKPAIIAECKRSSPSKGALADIDSPALLGKIYEEAGASVISVLTEERRFKGSLKDLDAVRAAVSIPVLRKDFIVDEYQIWEAKLHGANLVLLIVAALEDSKLKEFLSLVHDLGMYALVETHTEEEVERAVNVGARIIGVNARNLKTMSVDVEVFNKLSSLIPDSVVKVAESGVKTIEDVGRYVSWGADAVLIGEALVTSNDAKTMIKQMLALGIK